MFPPRPKAPAEDTSSVFVFVGSKFVAGRFPGIRKASSRKLRPFSGMFSTVVELIWPCTVEDRKSTRQNSSHVAISYAVFCMKKKNRRHTALQRCNGLV